MCIVLCVEVCNGILYLFMLLFVVFEDYFDLFGVIELIVYMFGVKFVFEGYLLLCDVWLKLLQVMFDFGVIEVNIYLVVSFDEFVDYIEFLYDVVW